MDLHRIIALLDKEIEVLKAVSNDGESFFVRTERQTVKQEAENTSCPTSPKQEEEEELVVSCIDKALQKAAETWSEVSSKQPGKSTEQSRVTDSSKPPKDAQSKPKPVMSGKVDKVDTNVRPAVAKPVQPAKANPAVNQNIGAKPKRFVPAHQKAPFKTFSEPVKGNHKLSQVSTTLKSTNEKTEGSPDVPASSRNSQEPEKPVPKLKIDKERSSPPRSSSSASTSTVNLAATQQQEQQGVVTPRSRMRSWLSERELPGTVRAQVEKQGEGSLKTVSKKESTSETNLKRTSQDSSSVKDGTTVKESETKKSDSCTEGSVSELPIVVQRGDFVRDFLHDGANSRGEHRLQRAANNLLAARKHCFEKMALDDNSTRVSNSAKAKFIAQVDAKLRSNADDVKKLSDAQRIATAASMCQEFEQLTKLLCTLPQGDTRAGPKSEGANTQRNSDDFQAVAYSRRVIERVLERAVQLERPYRELLAQSASQSRSKIDTRSAFENCGNKTRPGDRRCSRIVVYGSARELARLADLRCAVLAARIRLHMIDTHARSLVDAFESALVKGEASERAKLIRTYRALFRLVAHESPVVVLGQSDSP